tara:strand:+ start:523 stop:1578 length:1056 start_codon:yes stop_codon:yes gene_type:complete
MIKNNLYDKSLLVVTPDGYVEGKMWVTKPTDTSFTFNRGSTNVSYVGKDGYLKKEVSDTNVPRLDYSLGVPAFLIESSSQNLAPYSNITSTGWSENNATITENVTNSPEGSTNARLIEGSGNQHIYSASISVTSGNLYTKSLYIKNINSSESKIDFENIGYSFNIQWSGETLSAITNHNNPTKQTVKYDYLKDGWYRVYVTELALSSSCVVKIYPGGGTISCYGVQLEPGELTSLIHTSASSVTRPAEPNSYSINLPTTGTIYCFTGGTSAGVMSVLGESFTPSTEENKIAIAYSATNLNISLNGRIVVKKEGTYDVSSLSTLSLGQGNVYKAFYFIDEFLIDSELNDITD